MTHRRMPSLLEYSICGEKIVQVQMCPSISFIASEFFKIVFSYDYNIVQNGKNQSESSKMPLLIDTGYSYNMLVISTG